MKKMNFVQMEMINGGKCGTEGLYLAAAGTAFAGAVASGGWALIPATLCLMAAQKAFHDCMTQYQAPGPDHYATISSAIMTY